MAEWTIAPVLKTGIAARRSEVRILLSPPTSSQPKAGRPRAENHTPSAIYLEESKGVVSIIGLFIFCNVPIRHTILELPIILKKDCKPIIWVRVRVIHQGDYQSSWFTVAVV